MSQNSEMKISFHIWTALCLLCIVSMSIFYMKIVFAPDAVQVQYIPDDGYYYLVLARNFSNLGSWTFDSGETVTSGFHPLLAYILATVYEALQPTNEMFVRYGLMACISITLFLVLFLLFIGLRLRNTYYMISLSLLISSAKFIYNSVSIMEWPLVILFSSFYCIQFYRCTIYGRYSRGAIGALFLLGLLGSLSRSDFGLIAASFFVTTTAVRLMGYGKRGLLLSFAGLSGSTIGVLCVFAHNYFFSGELLQSSAKIKAHWASVVPPNGYEIIMQQIRSMFIGGDISVRLSAPIIGLIVLVKLYHSIRKEEYIFYRMKMSTEMDNILMLASATSCVFGYILFYGMNCGGIQSWYTANFVAPIFVIVFICSHYMDSLLGRRFTVILLSSIVIFIAVYNVTSLSDPNKMIHPMPYQRIMLTAGKYLAEVSLDGKIGSWNAGIIGYYQGGKVINLDGLVNNDVYPYIVTDRLPIYIVEKDIRYIIDFKRMIINKTVRMRRGYDDDQFLNSLKAIKVFDNAEEGSWRNMTLYRRGDTITGQIPSG